MSALAAALSAVACLAVAPPTGLAQPASLSAEFEALRTELVSQAVDIMRRHEVLIAIQGDVLDIEAEIAERERRLSAENAATAALTTALVGLGRMPPAAMLAHPEGTEAAVRAGIAFNAVLPGLTEQAETLAGEIAALGRLRDALASRRAAADSVDDELQRSIIRLGDLASARGALETALPGRPASDRAALEAELSALAARARNLRELLDGVAGAAPGPPELGPELPAARTLVPLPVPRPGMANGVRLPASGTVAVRFGEAGRFGPGSPGLEIEAYPGAPVVAPLRGQVRFADTFRGYGRMVIIEHADELYSLIAGLGQIDVAVGDSLAEGEPIGSASTPQNGHSVPVTLYFELRSHGQPVDPIVRLAEIRQRGLQ